MLLLLNLFLASSGYMKYLEIGYRLDRPRYWKDDQVWLTLQLTWHVDKHRRPSFMQLYEFFRNSHRYYSELELEMSEILTIPRLVALEQCGKVSVKSTSMRTYEVLSLPSDRVYNCSKTS